MTTPTEELLTAFKAYDLRGRVPDELDEDLAYRIGRAFVTQQQADSVVVGRDVRLTSSALCESLAHGLRDAGARVLDIGLCGTENVYFATSHLKAGGGIMVTASHNPRDHNGMKFVARDSVPLSGTSGLPELERRVRTGDVGEKRAGGTVEPVDVMDDYLEHLLEYVDPDRFRELTVVSNPGNGCAGPVMERLENHLPLKIIRLYHEPDGEFPNGIPNPLLPENRQVTADAVREHRADLALAWDGDFDRCFFFDERAQFVEGYYVVGLLASSILRKNPGAKVIHDPRLVWNTREVVSAANGHPVQSRCGHAFIKGAMREHDAVYGGEMSAHHYFREFAYCDSGMIPWLLLVEGLSRAEGPLSAEIDERALRYPISGEINREIADPTACLARVEDYYKSQAVEIDHTDGVSMVFDRWRFNLRMSNTEPLVRLNVESRGDRPLCDEKTEELLSLLQ